MGGAKFIAMLGEIATEGLTRIPIVKIGRWYKGTQKVVITKADLADVVLNFRDRANGEIPVDYDHSIELAAGKGDPVPAAGWLKRIEDAPDEHGILWGFAEWTDKARAMLSAKEYKYISAALMWGARDKKTGEQRGCSLSSIALTNQPVLEELPAITLSEAGWKETVDEPTERREGMIKQLILADRAAGTVRAVLEDGTEQTLSVEGFPSEAKPKVIALADIKRTQDGRFDFAALSEVREGYIDPAVIHAMVVQGELDAAVKAGKLTPAQRPAMETLALSDIGAFRQFIGAQTQQVQLGETGLAGGEGATDLHKISTKLVQLMDEKMKADATLSRGQAFKVVLSEHPDLEHQYQVLLREEK